MNVLARRAAFTATRAPVRVAARRNASGVTSGAESEAGERKAERQVLSKGQ